jgi:hypothetical protein
VVEVDVAAHAEMMERRGLRRRTGDPAGGCLSCPHGAGRRLDHLVLLTPDVERALGWWTAELG